MSTRIGLGRGNVDGSGKLFRGSSKASGSLSRAKNPQNLPTRKTLSLKIWASCLRLFFSLPALTSHLLRRFLSFPCSFLPAPFTHSPARVASSTMSASHLLDKTLVPRLFFFIGLTLVTQTRSRVYRCGHCCCVGLRRFFLEVYSSCRLRLHGGSFTLFELFLDFY
jgi:hypothetical protein